MSDKLIVKCPYCGHENHFNISDQEWRKSVHEVVTSLLAVRLGDHTSSFFVGKEWTEVGSLKGTINAKIMDVFNRIVGILRFPGKNTRIIWKEPLCSSPNCNAPFDIFISLTQNRGVSQIWPHLTGVVNEKGEYSLWPVQRDFEKLLSFFRFPLWGEAIIAILVLISLAVLSLLPDFASSIPNKLFVETATLRISCAVLVGFMITSLRAIGKELRQKQNLLRELLEVKSENSFMFWYNYMMARFAGADLSLRYSKTSRQLKNTHFTIHLTQAALIGGIPSVIVLLTIWLIIYLPHIPHVNNSNLFELFYWVVIAYFSGITAWISMNFSVFMTQNISLLPMKLTPLNAYSNVRSVRNIIVLSLISFVPVTLLPLAFIGSTFVLTTQSEILKFWLLPWFMFTFAFSLFIISIADRMMVLFGVLYIAILIVLIFTSLNQTLLLVVFGAFWTALLAYQLNHAFSPLQKVLEKNKTAFVHSLDLQLVDLTKKASEKTEQNGNTLSEIEQTLRIRDIAMKAKTSILNLPSTLSIFSPIFSSFVFPIVLDAIKNSFQTLFKI